LRQQALLLRAANRPRLALERAVVRESAVSRDGAHPAAEGACPLPLEAGQFADDDGHDILSHILGFVAKPWPAQKPAPDERPINIVEPLPRLFVGRGAKSLQQTKGGFHEFLGSESNPKPGEKE
jgi:hypothetical protein